MRVLFDAYWWNEGPPSNQAVQRELIRAWVERFPHDEAILAIPGGAATSAPVPQSAKVLRTRLSPHGVSAASWLPVLARKQRADLMITHNFTPVAGRAAVFVHDVLFQTDPDWFSRAERTYLAPIPALARRAEVVFTSSRSEADRIRTRNPGIQRVVPVGLHVKSALLGARPKRPTLPDLDGFVLSVGRLNVRKNLRTALSAAVASGVLTARRPMLVVGAPDGPSEEFDAPVRAASARGEILFLGALTDDEVAWLYRNADCFLFLSRAEGFGLPPLEAATFGCPVVVSDIPVMREVCADGAAFVPPDDVTAAAAAIRAALSRGRREPALPDADPWLAIVERMRAALVS